MIENMLRHMQRISPEKKIYLIKPNSLSVDLKLEELTVMDGIYNDISLRDNLLDLLIVIDLPPKRSLHSSIKQWHRVLSRKGRLAILTPSILIEKKEDPLTIGDFVEKYEHEILEQGQKTEKEFLKKNLDNYFRKVQERQIVHMTIMLVSQPTNKKTHTLSMKA